MNVCRSKVIAILLLVGTGCTNSVRVPVTIATSSPTPTSSSLPGTLTSQTLNVKITTVKVTENSSATGAPATSLFFDTKTVADGIPAFCSAASGGKSDKPCVCQFKWDEINGTTGVAVPHTVQTSITLVQQSLVSCPGPDLFSKEIPDGTQIKITIQPTKDNSQQFSISPVIFTKNSKVTTGSFQDSQGRSFDNILHYSCYEQFKKGLTIKSKIISYNDPSNGNTVKGPSASEFCLQKPGGVGSGTQGCENIDAVDNSAQANYFNLFIRDSERGDINRSNDRFICPLVQESLTSISGSSASQGQFWPLDSTFALSLGPSQDFPVGVVSASKVSNGQDPVAADSSCFGASASSSSSAGSGSTTNLVNSCLGFAAKPLSDGSCPSFKLPNGTDRPTFRLRRYVALYPPVFDAGGFPIAQPQGMDTVYVLDRPVLGSTDPTKPFSMKGPKPCPFAYFDKSNVTGLFDSNGGYAATNFVDLIVPTKGWDGKNVDGTAYPTDTELDPSKKMSCPAVISVPDSNSTALGIMTLTSSKNSRFIRPVKPWAPHYEEDTEFQACAPQATPLRDPPLHFVVDAKQNVSWCAEVYPTQNSDITAANPLVATPFTSHKVKGTTGSANTPCPFISSTAALDAKHGGAGAYDSTCNRTVVSANLAWPRFPLLAPAPEIESALAADSSYACSISFDSNKGKLGKTPSGGCCGSNVAVSPSSIAGTSAHLEPPAFQLPTDNSPLPKATFCETPSY